MKFWEKCLSLFFLKKEKLVWLILIFLLVKLVSGNWKLLVKIEFLLVCGLLVFVSVKFCSYNDFKEYVC